MSHREYLYLLAEKTELERMIAETPEDEALDRASLVSRLQRVEEAIAQAQRVGSSRP